MIDYFFAGYTKINIDSISKETKLPLHIFYPSDIPEKLEKLGPFQLDLAVDATPKNGNYPLVIFSHGSGSMPLLFRTLGQYLARNGFIIGMLEHPGNNRVDNSLVDTVDNLISRPTDLQTAIDWFWETSEFKSILISETVSLIGHSMGGYSALALAGGKPTPLPQEAADARPLILAKDPRVKSIILLAPATVWFREKGALSDIDIPILMYTAVLDTFTPKMPHAYIVMEGINNTKQIIYREVENAGHFSFMSVYPNELKSAALPPSQDPPGFNRQDFLDRLNPEIAEFLLKAI
ncbi:alpha/beta hydrolase [Chitinophaga oryziterrae]|uniref:Alpha/beta hydrolase n=2 Tax=Chitinophaga oryziterrae TaxID=1031224 RepID=A0A6N8J9G9_9BACT|nr:alpha/beta hydrolase [Chitinophaga oryziterrae]